MNVLITGATGLLGKSLIERNNRSHAVIGIYAGDYAMSDSGTVRYSITDIRDAGALAGVTRGQPIDVIIHTAGVANVDYCEHHYREAYESNVAGTRNIIALSRSTGALLVYTSTNAVFDGKAAPYREEDRVNPLNNYGKLKVECERMITAQLKDFLIVRPILMYGWNHERERKNLVTFLLERLPRPGIVHMVNDVLENPLSSYQCADAIWTLIEMMKRGVYHIAGHDIVNRYEYALTIADIFDLEAEKIEPVESSFFDDIALRPHNTSYSTEKIERELGFKPLGLKEGLRHLKELH